MTQSGNASAASVGSPLTPSLTSDKGHIKFLVDIKACSVEISLDQKKRLSDIKVSLSLIMPVTLIRCVMTGPLQGLLLDRREAGGC